MTWPITLTFDDLKMNCIFRMVYIGLKKLVATGRPPSGLPNARVDFPAIAAELCEIANYPQELMGYVGLEIEAGRYH
jgi:hypothetical protein